MRSSACQEEFVQLLTERQTSLLAYLQSLLGDVHTAHNLLQETNLVLWRKADEFEPGTDFNAWARKIAYFQVLAYLRDRKRDKHLFDAELLNQLAQRPRANHDEELQRVALRHCLSQLPEQRRLLVHSRYHLKRSIRQLADDWSKSESAIKMMLLRTREMLLRCIQTKLSEVS